MERRSHFKLEHRKEHPLSRHDFVRRMAAFLGSALGLILLVLLLAMTGYHALEGMNWVDAFLNAAMILGGMGPVSTLNTDAGKIFAGSYALFASLFFVVIAGLILTPIFHRAMHRFHFDEENSEEE